MHHRARTILHLLLALLATAPVVSVAAPSLSVYGGLPGFEMAALSPSGDRIAIIGELGGKRRVVILEGASKPLLSAALGDDVKIRGVYWAGEDHVLVYKSDTQALSPLDFTADKVELYSALVVPLNGQEPWSVFADSRSIVGGVRGFFGIRERRGKYYGYFSGMTMENTTTGLYLSSTNPVLYEVDFESGRQRRLAPNIEGRGHRDWIIGPEGEVSATLDFFNGSGDWSIRGGDGKRIADGRQPLGGVSLVGVGRTPGTIVYSVEDDDGYQRWIELPAGSGEPTRLLDDVAISRSFFDRRTQQLMGYQEEGDRPAYRFFEARKQRVIDGSLKAFPGKSVHLQDWNQQFDRLIVKTEGTGDPGTWWLVDIRTGQAVQLGVSYPLRPQDVGEVRMIQYKAGDGLDIAAVLTLPPGLPERNLPVVVLPHGGPGARDYPGFDWWAQAFASRGYAVLQPNFRGSTGYGIEFQRAGDGEWGRKMQSDISDGLAFLASEGIVDPRRACIVGASYGGYAALAGVTLQNGIYRCAASVSGIGDLTQLVVTEARESGDNATLLRVLRREIGSGRDLRAVSPIRFAAAADAPILLVHGRDDTVVNHAQSADMAEALRKAGRPVELLTLDGEDHWLSRGETRQQMLEAVVAFVERHNPAGAPPAASP